MKKGKLVEEVRKLTEEKALSYDAIVERIKEHAVTKGYRMDFEWEELISEVKQKLEEEGFEVNLCENPDDPNDHWFEVSWSPNTRKKANDAIYNSLVSEFRNALKIINSL